MSKISTFIDTLRTEVQALFANRLEIVNPLNLEDNPRNNQDYGFGITIDTSGESPIDVLQFTNNRYNATVILTQVVVKKESDADKYFDGLKALLEDELTLRKKLLSRDQLGIDDSVNLISNVNTGGVERFADNNRNLSISVSFDVDISEEI